MTSSEIYSNWVHRIYIKIRELFHMDPTIFKTYHNPCCCIGCWCWKADYLLLLLLLLSWLLVLLLLCCYHCCWCLPRWQDHSCRSGPLWLLDRYQGPARGGTSTSGNGARAGRTATWNGAHGDTSTTTLQKRNNNSYDRKRWNNLRHFN